LGPGRWSGPFPNRMGVLQTADRFRSWGSGRRARASARARDPIGAIYVSWESSGEIALIRIPDRAANLASSSADLLSLVRVRIPAEPILS